MKYRYFEGNTMDLMRLLDTCDELLYSKGKRTYRNFHNVFKHDVLTMEDYEEFCEKENETSHDAFCYGDIILLQIRKGDDIHVIKDGMDEDIFLSYYGTKYGSSIYLNQEIDETLLVVSQFASHNFIEYDEIIEIKNNIEHIKEEDTLRVKLSKNNKDTLSIVQSFNNDKYLLDNTLGFPSETYKYESMNIKLKEQAPTTIKQPKLTRQMSLLGEIVYEVLSEEMKTEDNNNGIVKNYQFEGDKNRVLYGKQKPYNSNSIYSYQYLFGHQKDVQAFIDSGELDKLYNEKYFVILKVSYLSNGLVKLSLEEKEVIDSYEHRIQGILRQERYQNKGILIHEGEAIKAIDIGDVSPYYNNNVLDDRGKIINPVFKKMLEEV